MAFTHVRDRFFGAAAAAVVASFSILLENKTSRAYVRKQ
jgi:hypothetical protein